MRQLFFALCMLNVAAALWWSMSKGNSVQHIMPARDRAPSLRLLAKPMAREPTGARQDEGCLLYGPITSLQAETLVAAAVKGARVVETRRSQPGDYWLYLPTGGDGASRILEELASGGIEGFVFLGGELAGNVALGGYSSLEAAGRARQRYVAMGYDVAIHAMEREIIDYWAAFPAGAGTEPVAAEAARMNLALAAPEIVGNSCEMVASGGQFP